MKPTSFLKENPKQIFDNIFNNQIVSQLSKLETIRQRVGPLIWKKRIINTLLSLSIILAFGALVILQYNLDAPSEGYQPISYWYLLLSLGAAIFVYVVPYNTLSKQFQTEREIIFHYRKEHVAIITNAICQQLGLSVSNLHNDYTSLPGKMGSNPERLIPGIISSRLLDFKIRIHWVASFFSKKIIKTKYIGFMDEQWKTTIASMPLWLREVHIKKTTDGIDLSVRKGYFRGTFITVDLAKKVDGHTLVTTENDRLRLRHTDGVNEDLLEWNEFEYHLRIHTDNPVVAREIFTPDFMAYYYDWWHHSKKKVRMSFIGQNMYILIPDKNLDVTHKTTHLPIELQQKYMYSYFLNIWYTQKLLELLPRQLTN